MTYKSANESPLLLIVIYRQELPLLTKHKISKLEAKKWVLRPNFKKISKPEH